MDPVERKLACLFDALAEENQRLLALLDAGCTLAEAERTLEDVDAEAVGGDVTPRRHVALDPDGRAMVGDNPPVGLLNAAS